MPLNYKLALFGQALSRNTEVSEKLAQLEKMKLRPPVVDVYGRGTCTRTNQVLKFYEILGIQPRFHDVDSNFAAELEVRAAGIASLPLVKVNGKNLNSRSRELPYEWILKFCK